MTLNVMTPMTVVLVVLLVGTLVLIHEGGHYLVARACGVSVKVFSIGFGKRLFGWKIGKTDFRVSMLPLGGYVRWVGGDPFADGGADDDQDWIDAKGSFIHKPAWQRLLIVAAGPLTNLILPIFVFTGLYIAGEPQPAAEVGFVEPGSAAAEAGLRAGDKLLSVNGESLVAWGDFSHALVERGSAPARLEVERGGAKVALELAAEGDYYEVGLSPYYADVSVLVDDPASPAGRAGVRTGDRIQKVNGVAVRHWVEVGQALGSGATAELEVARRVVDEEGESRIDTLPLTLRPDPTWTPERYATDDDVWATWGLSPGNQGIGEIRRLPDGTQTPAQCSELREGDHLLRVGDRDVYTYNDVVRGVAHSVEGVPEADGVAKPVEFVVRRGGVLAHYTVTPDINRVVAADGSWNLRPIVGLNPVGAFTLPPDVRRPYGPVEAIRMAVTETGQTAGFMLERIGQMITGDAPVNQNLGGPIEVFSALGAAAEEGIFAAARTFAAMSLSLGVINLLPIPVLDGGQLVTYAAEWLRGRPLPYVLRERLQQAGLLFLVGLLLVVSVMDVQRHTVDEPTADEELPPKCA